MRERASDPDCESVTFQGPAHTRTPPTCVGGILDYRRVIDNYRPISLFTIPFKEL